MRIQLIKNCRNRTRLKRNSFFGVSILTLTACFSVDSNGISSSEMDVRISVDAENNTTEITATIETVGAKFDTNFIRLTAGDRLSASMDGETTYLQSDGAILHLSPENNSFEGRLNNTRGGSEVIVALDRVEGEDAQAWVTLPAPLNITAPAFAETFSSDESISIAWTPGDPEESAQIIFRTECPTANDSGITSFRSSIHTPDTGATTVPVSDIAIDSRHSRFSLPTGVTCNTEISAVRSNRGSHNFGFGSITASQRSRVVVNLMP